MQKRRPQTRCAIQGCSNGAWTKRNLKVCSDCAQDIVRIMTWTNGRNPITDLRWDNDQLRQIIARQSRQLRALRNGDDDSNDRPQPATDGIVYYVRVGAYIKIGWTSDLAKRMRAYSPDSVLLATEPGTRKDEARRHKMFAVHRTHGREWYAMVPSLMHHIEQVAVRHGAPDPVTFAAKPVEIPQPRDARPVMPRGWSGHATVAS